MLALRRGAAGPAAPPRGRGRGVPVVLPAAVEEPDFVAISAVLRVRGGRPRAPATSRRAPSPPGPTHRTPLGTLGISLGPRRTSFWPTGTSLGTPFWLLGTLGTSLGTPQCTGRTRLCPLITRLCPLKTRLCPLIMRLCPLEMRLCPLISRLCPLEMRLCPLKNQQYPLITRLCPLTTRLCPPTTRLCPARRSSLPPPRCPTKRPPFRCRWGAAAICRRWRMRDRSSSPRRTSVPRFHLPACRKWRRIPPFRRSASPPFRRSPHRISPPPAIRCAPFFRTKRTPRLPRFRTRCWAGVSFRAGIL